jgi:hypothetical protein
MVIVDNTFISEDLFKQHFVCDISCCKGICCVEGDAGAPLEEEEIAILEDCLDKIKPYMTKEGIEIVQQGGIFDYDIEGVLVTPLVNDRECVFVYYENDIAQCAIEKAYLEGKTDFQKPISCHLYPVRLTKQNCYEKLNYHQWGVCRSARMNGKRLQISVFDFLQTPLARKYGDEWINKVKKIIHARQL